jgi:hypothetical protein
MSVFRDMRLDKRLEQLKLAMRQKQKACLTETLETWASLKAGYRFLK